MRLLLSFLMLGWWVLWGAGAACGQDGYYLERPKVFEGGVAAGLNFTQIDGDTYYGYHKVALNAGALVYVHFGSVLGASMGIDYSRKGSRGEVVAHSAMLGDYVRKYYMNVNYIEVPLTVHVISHQFDFEVGASYGRLLNAKEWIEADKPVVIDPERNRFNTTDVDMILGMGHKVYKHWHVCTRFQYSLTSIRPPERIPAGYGWGGAGQYNNMFSLRFLYLF